MCITESDTEYVMLERHDNTRIACCSYCCLVRQRKRMVTHVCILIQIDAQGRIHSAGECHGVSTNLACS